MHVCEILYLCAPSEEQSSYTSAASSQSLDAITSDLVTPWQVQHLQHSAAITEHEHPYESQYSSWQAYRI